MSAIRHPDKSGQIRTNVRRCPAWTTRQGRPPLGGGVLSVSVRTATGPIGCRDKAANRPEWGAMTRLTERTDRHGPTRGLR